MTAIAKKNLDHWSRVPQTIEAHNNEGPITLVPQEQKYTLHSTKKNVSTMTTVKL